MDLHIQWIYNDETMYISVIKIEQLQMVIHAFVASRIDYCNSLLIGLPNGELAKQQRGQNAPARLLSSTREYDHITPVLHELHWLPV